MPGITASPMKTLLAGSLLLWSCGIAAAVESDTSGTTAPYVIRNGKVFLPVIDDSNTTTAPKMILKPMDFADPKTVREDRLLVENDPAISNPIVIPSNVSSIAITARASVSLDVWPKVRISIVCTGCSPAEYILFDDYWVSRSMTLKEFTIPRQYLGKEVNCMIEVMNPSDPRRQEPRILYLAEIAFR